MRRFLHSRRFYASRGTRIHNSIEKYLRGDDTYFEGVPQENRELIQLGLKQIDERVDNIRGIELGMWSDSLGLAGTSDLVADYQGELSIIDWKTQYLHQERRNHVVVHSTRNCIQ